MLLFALMDGNDKKMLYKNITDLFFGQLVWRMNITISTQYLKVVQTGPGQPVWMFEQAPRDLAGADEPVQEVQEGEV